MNLDNDEQVKAQKAFEEFGDLSLELFHKEGITPYVHIVACHAYPQWIRVDNLQKFGGQGEKKFVFFWSNYFIVLF